MCLNKVFTQNYYEIKSSLHPDLNYMDIEQKIIFHNNSENKSMSQESEDSNQQKDSSVIEEENSE